VKRVCLQSAARGFTVHSVQLWKCNPVLFDSNCRRISEQHVLCSSAAGCGGGCLACSMLVFSVRQMFLAVVGPSWTGGDNALVLMGVVIGENVWDTRQLCGV